MCPNPRVVSTCALRARARSTTGRAAGTAACGTGARSRTGARRKQAAANVHLAREAIAEHVLGNRVQFATELRQDRGDATAVLERVHDLGAQLLDRRAPAVQAAVNARVKVLADDAADSDDEHAVERDGAVDGAEREVAVVEDHQRAQEAEDHVDSEPVPAPAAALHELPFLPGRVQQQKQHQRAADDAEPVADALRRIHDAMVAQQPADAQRDHQQPVPDEAALLLAEHRPALARPAGGQSGNIGGGVVHVSRFLVS